MFPHLKLNGLSTLLENLERVEFRLNLLNKARFSPKDLENIDFPNLTQMDILKLAQIKIQECIPVERLDVIREMSAEDQQ